MTKRDLTRKFNDRTVMTLSGKTYYVSNGQCIISVDNGSARLLLLTGMSCTVTSFIGCFTAVTNNYFVVAVGGFILMGVDTKLADEQAQSQDLVSFQVALFDRFATLTSTEFKQCMKTTYILLKNDHVCYKNDQIIDRFSGFRLIYL